MPVQASQTMTIRRCLANPTTGAASFADSLPTAVLIKQGTATAQTVVVSAGSNPGEYNFTFTTPSAGLSDWDRLDLEATATVAGVTGRATIWSDFVQPLNITYSSLTITGCLSLQSDINIAGNVQISGRLQAAAGMLTGCTTVSTFDPTSDTVLLDAAQLSTIATVANQNTLLARLTAARAGYLDNISAGPVALATAVAALPSASTIAATVEAHILDDTDGEAVLTAIVNKINSVDTNLAGLTLSAIAAQVQTVIERAGGMLALVQAQANLIGTNAGDSPATKTAQSEISTAYGKLPAGNIGDATEANATANKSAVLTAVGTPLQTTGYTAPNNAGITSILNILSGITSLPKWLRAMFSKAAPDATALSEINTGGGTVDPTTDSLQAIRDRGDAAWIGGGTGGAGGLTTEEDAALFDIQAKVTAMGANPVTVTSPISADGAIYITRGDDYKAADARALTFAISGTDLTGATVKFLASPFNSGCAKPLVISGVFIGSTASIDLPASFTGLLEEGNPAYLYWLIITLADGSTVTPATGSVIVKGIPSGEGC